MYIRTFSVDPPAAELRLSVCPVDAFGSQSLQLLGHGHNDRWDHSPTSRGCWRLLYAHSTATQDSPTPTASSTALLFLGPHRCSHPHRQPVETLSRSCSQAVSPTHCLSNLILANDRALIYTSALLQLLSSPVHGPSDPVLVEMGLSWAGGGLWWAPPVRTLGVIITPAKVSLHFFWECAHKLLSCNLGPSFHVYVVPFLLSVKHGSKAEKQSTASGPCILRFRGSRLWVIKASSPWGFGAIHPARSKPQLCTVIWHYLGT